MKSFVLKKKTLEEKKTISKCFHITSFFCSSKCQYDMTRSRRHHKKFNSDKSLINNVWRKNLPPVRNLLSLMKIVNLENFREIPNGKFSLNFVDSRNCEVHKYFSCLLGNFHFQVNETHVCFVLRNGFNARQHFFY